MASRRNASPERRQTLEGVVRDVAFGGEAVVETNRGVVFALFGLPGERVRLRDVRRAGRVLRGHIEAVLTPSPDRVEPACPLVARCGGCPLMMMSRDAQHARARRLIERAVAAAPGGEAVGVDVVSAGPALGYRRRARLAFVRSPGRPHALIGYRERRSHRVTDVPACPVLDATLGPALVRVREHLAPLLEGEGEVRLGRGEGGATVTVTTQAPQSPALYEAARAMACDPAIAGVALRVGGTSVAATFGDPRERAEGVDGAPLLGTVGGFSQASAAVNERLVACVLELSAPTDADVLELYAGHGNLTVALAARARSVVAVEQDPAAAAALRENLDARGLSAVVRCADAGRAVGAGGPRVDLVVLNPPRTGAREVLAGIAARRPARIVYVSCDPATLGRDLALLGDLGFVVDAACGFDMFPHTGHVETVVRLSRG